MKKELRLRLKELNDLNEELDGINLAEAIARCVTYTSGGTIASSSNSGGSISTIKKVIGDEKFYQLVGEFKDSIKTHLGFKKKQVEAQIEKFTISHSDCRLTENKED